MRILLDYRPALRARTGVGEYVHEVARALVATKPAGEILSLFSASWRDRLSPDVVPGTATIDRHIPVRLLNLAWHRLHWPSVERLTGEQFDVVQGTHPLLIPSDGAARLVTIYDLDFLDHPERTTAEIRRDYAPLAAIHALRADQVIVISRDTASAVERRLGVPSSHITLAVPGAPEWPRRTEEPAAGYILFIGTLEPRKNLGVLLDAYARLVSRRPTAPRLVLAGRRTDSAAAIVLRTREAPLAGRVDLLGYIERENLPALYAGAMVVVMPSHTEGFGLPVIEAQVSGVPVVAANRGALPEAVGEGGLMFDPESPDALAVLLERLMDDPGLRTTLADAGVAHARRFRWTETARHVREAWSLAIEHRLGRG